MSFKQTADRILIALGFSMLLGIGIIPGMRDTLADVVGFFMEPISSELPFHILLFVLAAITGLYATLIQKYTIDWEFTSNMQKKMREFQKEFREVQLSQNQVKIAKMKEEQAAMMGDQMQMMKQQFKPMAYISIISIPLFMWIHQFITTHPDAVMNFPFWGQQALTESSFWIMPNWIVWYFMCSLAASQIIRKSLNVGITA